MEVRDRIIQAARKSFVLFGIRGVTMDQIAQEAGVSKRTIYEIFADKGELLLACIEYMECDMEKHRQEIENSSQNVIETMYRHSDFHIKMLEDFNPLFFMDMQKFYPAAWDIIFNKFNQKKYHDIKRLLQVGLKQGLFRKDIHLEIATKVLLEQTKMAMTLDMLKGGKYSRKDIFNNLVINYIRGISSESGLELLNKYYK
ncbi:MAG: TetR/AcrR family transcriptional regulator [Bacteroidales bacterium]|jgi:AcrR family transcriptional regulator|nr:TetR/AcrR family transcriptional regulator [Bacteroidales bacterium]